MTLSGGALGLFFAFTKDIVGTENLNHPGFLLCAWIGGGVSSTAILMSFFTSQLAIRKAIRQLDAGKLGMERPGGWFDRITASLNFTGLILFLFGLGMMMTFLSYNLKSHMKNKQDSHDAPLLTGQLMPKAPIGIITAQEVAGRQVPTPPVIVVNPQVSVPQAPPTPQPNSTLSTQSKNEPTK